MSLMGKIIDKLISQNEKEEYDEMMPLLMKQDGEEELEEPEGQE